MFYQKDSLPTPQASSNPFNSKLSEAVLDKNENAASSWAGVLICKKKLELSTKNRPNYFKQNILI
jgi:hypothetical protein